MAGINVCTFSNFETGEVREMTLTSLSDDPVQDLNELVIDMLQKAICDASVFGFGKCKLEYTYHDGDTFTNNFSTFDELKQYYKFLIGVI